MQPSKIFLSKNKDQTIASVLAYVGGKGVQLDSDPDFQGIIDSNHGLLLRKIEEGLDIYGANTGLGSSSKNRFDFEWSRELQKNLYSYHGCGVGPLLSERESAAIMFIRTHCLCQGFSGVSYDLLAHMTLMLENRVFPAIPSLGSVGASGDLTPLAYVAAAIAGERQVYYQGRVQETADVYRSLQIKPYKFKPREALAIMNGTSVMTGIMVLAWDRLHHMADLMCSGTGLLVELLDGCSAAYMDATHQVKKHQGQRLAASRILSFLNNIDDRLYNNPDGGIQDRYSLRCTPQIVGVLFDTLEWSLSWVENELNSVSDNPVFSGDAILNGGHFFGGHIAQAADSLKTTLATTINLLDRQMAFLMEVAESRFSENLVLKNQLGEKAILNHGFKAMQITMSAIAAELIKQSTPMSIFSRPTETSNQDVVSMGTIAARDLTHMLNLAEANFAIMFMALVQGFHVREDLGHNMDLNQRARKLLTEFGEVFPRVVEDRPMDGDIVNMKTYLFSGS